MATAQIAINDFHNPIDIAETVIMERDWAFDRTDDGELLAEANGAWCNYKIWLSWQEEVGGLSISCALDSKIQKASLPKIFHLLALVNEKIWLGNFNISSEDNSVVFRHSLMLREGAGTNAAHLQELLDTAISESERFYPAFQSVVWGGKTPKEALELALFETIGEA